MNIKTIANTGDNSARSHIVFTAGRKINAAFMDDVFGFVITPFQGAVASVTGWVNDAVDDIIKETNLPTKTDS